MCEPDYTYILQAIIEFKDSIFLVSATMAVYAVPT